MLRSLLRLLVLLLILHFVILWFLLKPGIDMVEDLPPYGVPVDKTAQWHSIIKLTREGKPFCTGFVIDANYALTAGHCISSGGYLKQISVDVWLADDTDTKIRVEPVAINNRLDTGLLKGDFSNFKSFKVNFYDPTFVNNYFINKFESCGFPYGQRRLTCVTFKPKTNAGFSIAGTSFLIPGMSGGPLIDTTENEVIGINIAMGDGYAYCASTLGLLGAFGIEPKK